MRHMHEMHAYEVHAHKVVKPRKVMLKAIFNDCRSWTLFQPSSLASKLLVLVVV